MELKSEGIREVFWMFADEENHKKKPKTKLGEEVIHLYEDYQNSDEFLTYCNIERDRLIIKSRMMQSEKKGERNAKLEICQKIIKEKYPHCSLDWLIECSTEQLDKVFELIFQDISYEEFKIQVLNN